MNFGLKILLVWIIVSIILSLGGYDTTESTDTISNFVDINYTDGTIQDAGDLDQKTGLEIGGNSTGGFWSDLGMIAPIFLVVDGIRLLFRFFFAPVIMLYNVGAPFPIIAILGIVPIVALFVAVLGFVRGKDF